MGEEMFEGFESLGVWGPGSGSEALSVGSAGWLEQITGAGRAENRAAAAQLVAIGGLFAQRLAESPDEAREWAIDTMEATAAEVGAGLRISQGRAATKVHYARVMRTAAHDRAGVLRRRHRPGSVRHDRLAHRPDR